MLSKIIVNSPWYYFLLSLLLGFGLALLLYYRNKKNSDVPKIIFRVLFVLRFLIISSISFLLLTILFRRVQNETQNPVILLAIDNSTSMASTADSVSLKNNFLPALSSFSQTVSEKFSVKNILFGDKVNSTEMAPDFSERETDMESLLLDVENNYSNQNVGALIIFSDGIYNKGASPVRLAEKSGYPIYTIAWGDTNEVKDIAIQKVNHNQVAYAGNNFPVEVVVNAKKYQGKEVTVSLLRNGIEKTKQTLKITSADFLATCNFSLTAESSGFVRYTAKVSVLEDEKNVSNNNQSFVIEIIDNREKILLLAGAPHPDLSALREAIASSITYELEYARADEFKQPLKVYSLVILHGHSGTQIPVINECRTNSIPLWIINPRHTESIPGVKITGSQNRYSDSEPVVSSSFGLFTITDNLKNFMSDLPAVKTVFGNYALSNGANSLINQRIGAVETENPILFFNQVNGLKSAVFLGDGLWRWKTRDYEEHSNTNLFNELVSKSIQFLAIKSDKSFFRINAPKLINENEAVELSAEVYNKSYELISDPDVTLNLTNADGKKFNYTFGKSSGLYRLNIGLLPAGEYSYEAKVKVKDELFVKKGIILVKEVVAEKINTIANHQLLYQVSTRSKGKLYYPTDLQKLRDELLKSEQIKPITYSQVTTSPLIEVKFLFWLLLILLATEWFFRKRYYSI